MAVEEFWSDGDGWNLTWTWTLAVFLLIFTCRFLPSLFALRFHFFGVYRKKPQRKNAQPLRPNPIPQILSSGIVSDLDLKTLMNDIDENSPANADVIWENVIEKRNNSLAYKAKCCKLKDGGPLKYLSVTTFEDCPVEVLLNFYMDNQYRMQWDKTVVNHQQLEMDQSSGTEIGRTVKKFPFLTPREYVTAWRVWKGMEGSYYCFSKECEHPLAPKEHKKYIRVGLFRSGWRIRKVPGRNASEIRMVHQEDAGLNVEWAKLAFAKGIWSYVCKMNDGLRKYPAGKRQELNSTASATMYIQKVPPEFEITKVAISTVLPENSTSSVVNQAGMRKSNTRKLTRSPSKKSIANGLIVVGGLICLSRGHSSLGAKVAMAYILGKLTKRGTSSNPTGKIQCS